MTTITFEEIAQNIAEVHGINRKIDAIKQFRLVTKSSLKDAKTFIDKAFEEKESNKNDELENIVNRLLELDNSGYDYTEMDNALLTLREVWNDYNQR